jgi:hypothetical protein
MRRWRDLIVDAPRQATLTAWAGTTGEWPFLPPDVQNQWLISVGYVWVGEPDDGHGLLRSLREVAQPIAERIQALPYLELQRMEDDEQGHHFRRYWKGHYLRRLDDETIDAFVSRGVRDGDDLIDSPFLPSGDLQSYGGAIADVAAGETAFSHRDTMVEFTARARWEDASVDEARMARARRYAAAMEPFASGAYVNSLADEGEAGVRRAYGSDTMARLSALKVRYDPDNVFHLNHNIRPAHSSRSGAGHEDP